MSAPGDVVLRAEGLRRTFGQVAALDGVSLEVEKGEMFALLGASGSGKTTLLRLLAGFERPDAGRVLIDGRDVTDVPPYERPVNMMFQSYALFPHMTVLANVAFGLRQETGRSRLSKTEIRDRAQQALRLVRLEEHGGRRPQTLSGGEQQRVALARAIVKRPRVLLLDEPLAALDRKLRAATQLELVRIQAETGIAFVIVTHDQEEAMSLSDRMAVLRAGRIVQSGSPQQVYDFPNSLYVADFIGSANLLEGTVVSIGRDGAHVDCAEAGCVALVAEPPAGLHIGQTLHVAVRPERVEAALGTAPAGAVNAIGGTARDVAFLGNQSRLTVELGSGKLITAVRLNPGPETAPLRPGSRVCLSWAARDVRCLVS